MRISSKARYAVLAMIELARTGDYVSVPELAARRDMPRTFLGQLLLRLKDEGLIVSRRGPDGGYALAGPPERIRLADIYTAVEGPVHLRNGGSDLGPDGVSDLSDDEARVWGGLEDVVLGYMNGVTLIDLVNADAAGDRAASPTHQYTFSI